MLEKGSLQLWNCPRSWWSLDPWSCRWLTRWPWHRHLRRGKEEGRAGRHGRRGLKGVVVAGACQKPCGKKRVIDLFCMIKVFDLYILLSLIFKPFGILKSVTTWPFTLLCWTSFLDQLMMRYSEDPVRCAVCAVLRTKRVQFLASDMRDSLGDVL